MAKWVYLFEEGNADMRNLLGGKGANLAEMTNLDSSYMLIYVCAKTKDQT